MSPFTLLPRPTCPESASSAELDRLLDQMRREMLDRKNGIERDKALVPSAPRALVRC